jgi:polar amino acid transport system substrate-binding protein
MQDYTVDEFLADNPAYRKNIIKVEKPLKRKEYYLVFSRRFYNEHKELAHAIWDAIEDYSSTDEFSERKKKFEK